MRGLITLHFLDRLEKEIAAQTGRTTVRLHEYFQLVGGTSTGALIAVAVALGYGAAEIAEFYRALAPQVFRPSRFRIGLFQARFAAKQLAEEIRQIVGERTLESRDIKTGLAIVTKRLDTGGVWVVTNCTESQFWNDPPDGRFIGNRHYRLLDLLRASTAAPSYFAPVSIDLFPGTPAGVFVDGGVSPYNNPALLLLQVATLKAYGWAWSMGAEQMKLVSIGTGAFRHHLASPDTRYTPALHIARTALISMISDNSEQVLAILQWLGRTEAPWPINSEVGDLTNEPKPGPPPFAFWRWNANIDRPWLQDTLGHSIAPTDVERLRQMDDPTILDLCDEVGRAAAARQVTAESVRRLLGEPAEHSEAPHSLVSQ